MICRVSPKLPRGRGRGARSGTVVTCELPVNIMAGCRPESPQNRAQSAGRSGTGQYRGAMLTGAQRVDDLLMKMHESNPLPKSHNKKIHSSF